MESYKLNINHIPADKINWLFNMRVYIYSMISSFLTIRAVIVFISVISSVSRGEAQDKKNTSGDIKIREGNIGGYMIAQTQKVDQSYNAGFSIYAAAWPLLKEYPGSCFQSGLFGTWMFPFRDNLNIKEKLYSDIEGGLGWWHNTGYGTVTPKFIMGGVELNFASWANGPGAGKGRDWSKPNGKYGVAQLSPFLLFPPDGLNLKKGTSGEMFGYGYLPLPLTEEKSVTAETNVPTGNQSWTLFINTENFKGPVAFFTPYFWSKATVEKPEVKGLFLDVLPSNANKAFQMETQYIPSAQSIDAKGETYVKITTTQYPVSPDGSSVLLNRLMVYNRKALWDRVNMWFKGGNPVDGTIDTAGAIMQKFNPTIRSTWKIYADNIPKNKQAVMNINTQLNANSSDSATLRINWNNKLIARRKTKQGDLLILPEYYHLLKEGNDSIGKWIAVTPDEVPAETGLRNLKFKKRNFEESDSKGYFTPEEKESSWKKPGPVAGPFKIKLGDGSTITYYWYRFADQPALLNADLTSDEREEMQKRVEKLQRLWTKDREYLPPPTVGKLAAIDPALIVIPPAGLEVGYVPIVTRQEMKK